MPRRLTEPRRLAARAVLAWGVLACVLGLAGRASAQCERARLEAFDPSVGDQLGEAVALSSGWLLVGAPSGLPAGQGDGRVLAFRRQAGEWLLEQELVAADGSLDARFGAAVAMDDNLAAVGAPEDDEAGPDAGAVYVWVRLGDTWFNLDKLTAADGAPGDGFGASVAVSGDRIVVGARRHDALGPQSGAVYVFENPVGGSSWQQVDKLLSGDPAPGDAFGVSVAAHGELIVVGSDLADDGGVSAGAAHVFREGAQGFEEEAKLLPADPMASAFFGREVAVDEGCLVVAAPGQLATPHGGGPPVDAGAAYVFEETAPGTWTQAARLQAPEPVGGDTFGASLALRDGLLLAGATLTDHGSPNVGSVHVFRDAAGTWVHERELLASDAAAGDNFGIAVALEGTYAAVGAYFQSESASNAGRAYVFRGLSDLDVWSDAGFALAGSLGDPCAFGEGSLEPDTALLISLNGAKPGTVAGLVVGAAEADLPFKGGTLVPDPLLVVFGLPTLDGQLDLVVGWPAGIPSGLPVYWQHMIVDDAGPVGFSGSNAVVSITP